MARLNSCAFEILRTEIQKCAGNDFALQVQQEIVLRRLERLRSQGGSPLSFEEMRKVVIDFFPNFDEKVLKAAVKANRPPSMWSKLPLVAVILAGSAGMI